VFRQVTVYDFVGAALGATPTVAVKALLRALCDAVAAGPIGGVQLEVGAKGEDGSGIIEIISRDEADHIDIHLIALAKSAAGEHVLEFERHIGKALAVAEILKEVRKRVAAGLGDTR
jgi:hypothetical protein